MWPSHYPDQQQLKREVAAIVTALQQVLHRRGYEVQAMYAKGSAYKQWDSPIDYVPSLSDVDVHVRMELSPDLDTSLAISAEIEEAFLRIVPKPLHMPILQVSFLHELEKESGYHPSPPGATHHISGPAYVAGDLPAAAAQERAIAQLLANNAFLEGKSRRIFYKEGWALGRVMRDIAWRISAIGPHVLTLHGVPYAAAWSKNRTSIVQALHEVGEEELAQCYKQFYEQAWAYFLSADTDYAAARASIRNGIRAIARGVELAHSPRNP